MFSKFRDLYKPYGIGKKNKHSFIKLKPGGGDLPRPARNSAHPADSAGL